MRAIAQGLRRAPSTLSRAVARHGGRAQYRANAADQQAWESALRPKPCLLTTDDKLQEIVASKLLLDWSAEQISGWLKMQYPNDESLRVSHETIYRSLFIQARGALKQELIQPLRSKLRIRRSRHSSVHGYSRRSRRSRSLGGRSVARPNTKPSRWRRISKFTSAIRRVPGSVAQTKTPTAYCGNTCQRTPTCPGSRNRSWTRSLCDSVPGHDKPWNFELRRINCRPVLLRPLETTPAYQAQSDLLTGRSMSAEFVP
jgi:IS30 family transposase